MSLKYEVTGYDLQTGRLAVSYDVPVRKTALIKQIAGISPADDGLGSYPLDLEQISQITSALNIEIEQGQCNFFLEPYEEPR